MAKVHLALKKLFEAEFNNNPDLFVHKNHGEIGLTVGGVYQRANPNALDYNFINIIITSCLKDLKRASRMLYYDIKTMESVVSVFKNRYWDMLKLDKVHSQKIANEIFLFAVVSGVRNGAKLAQKMVGVVEDGIIGNVSLRALNEFDENLFDTEFDKLEIDYFESLAMNNEKLNRFLNGWRNRAIIV